MYIVIIIISYTHSKDFVLVQSYLGLGEPWHMPGHPQWWTGSRCFHGDRSWMGWDTPPRSACCLHTSSSWWRGSTRAWAARTYLHSLYIPPHFVHTCTVCTCLHSSMYQHSLYTPAHFVHTCTVCTHLHSSTYQQFVHTCTVCTWLHSLYIPVQFIYTCTVCTYLHSLYIHAQCIHTCTVHTYLHSLYIPTQFIDLGTFRTMLSLCRHSSWSSSPLDGAMVVVFIHAPKLEHFSCSLNDWQLCLEEKIITVKWMCYVISH